MYKKLIKIDADKNIIDFKLDWQIGDKTDYIEIGETDDKHFKMDVMDQDFLYIYQYKNKKIIEKDLTADRAKKEALAEYKALEKDIPDAIEAIYDALPKSITDNIDTGIKTLIAEKKIKRAAYEAL